MWLTKKLSHKRVKKFIKSSHNQKVRGNTGFEFRRSKLRMWFICYSTCLECTEPWVSSLVLHKTESDATHLYPNTEEVERRGSGVQCYPQVNSKSEAGLGYGKPCHKEKQLRECGTWAHQWAHLAQPSHPIPTSCFLGKEMSLVSVLGHRVLGLELRCPLWSLFPVDMIHTWKKPLKKKETKVSFGSHFQSMDSEPWCFRHKLA